MSQKSGQFSNRPNPLVMIGIIIVGVAAIIVLIIASMSTGEKDNNQNTDSRQAGDYKTEFYQYANYIISGEESDKALAHNKSETQTYALDKALKSEDEKQKRSFLDKAKTLLSNFYIDFTEAKLDDVDQISKVKSYRDSFMMIYLYETNEKLLDGNIMVTYYEQSEDAAKKLIEGSYTALVDSDSDFAKSYGGQLREYGKLLLTRYISYKNNGCFKDTGLDIKCVNGLSYDSDVAELEKYKRIITQTYNNTVSDLVAECWDISSLISTNNKGGLGA